MAYLDYISAALLFIIVGVPTMMISIELLLGQRKKAVLASKTPRQPCVILMPAHNEALVITDTLSKLSEVVSSEDKVIVIADNCSDETVNLCLQFNVKVLERHNTELAGKGYALDYGVQYLKSLSVVPQTLVVLDADCEFEANSLDVLVHQSQTQDSVVQSLYLMKSPIGASIKTRVAEFAWLVKNKIRPNGLANLGIGCHLQGSGMAFPWRLFNKISFASGSIVEDLELGLKLANIDEQAKFGPSAIVNSYFPESNAGTESQRTRWEHGHLSAISLLPKMMLTALLKGRVSVFLLALDAAIPPTILWLMLVLFTTLLSGVMTLLGLTSAFYISCTLLGLLVFSLALSWLCNGREIIKLSDVFGILAYIFSKFSIYKKFFTARQKEWVRTERDDKYE
ncbi:glycosyltransferase [Shewanella olleyana]|uniref:glycosyltransferase family 2 protein n=1 Tax=Shewanella olleyana TaxID=135626 RepID=UPI00200C9757|nr:glycosyltransferase family 2 protein [Shewanella olleyana]MCL1065350.1 glycosyltransferase [Shewanella olleyana]